MRCREAGSIRFAPTMNAFASAVFALLAAAAPAQQEPMKSNSEVVRFEVETKAAGKPEPRLDASGKDTGARQWQGRVLAWRVGDKTFADWHDVEVELRRVATDPASLRKDPTDAQRQVPPPLELDPAANSHWRDVLEQWDAVQMARFKEVRLRGVPTRELMAHGVASPEAHGGALRVPAVVFNMLDDDAGPERHVFDVMQDGRILHDGREVFRKQLGKTDDLAALDRLLREVRASLAKAGYLEKRGAGAQCIAVPVMIRADEACEWGDVQRLLLRLVAPEIGYGKLQLAVMDKLDPPPRDGAERAKGN
jgi:hypothetical protein